MVLALLLFSGVLTLAGTTCASFAFRATWRAYGGGKAMFPRMARALLPLRRLAFWRKPQVVSSGGVASMSATASGSGRRVPPAFPESALMRTQVAWLRREHEVAERRVTNLENALRRSEVTLREEVKRSDQRHREAVDATRTMAKDIAIGDVPLQLLSLLLISGGALCGIAASIVAL